MHFHALAMQLAVAASLALLLAITPTSGAGVMGIDFGTDWYKFALVKSGVPLELVMNRDSQRKTDAVVTIRDGQRIFGTDAVNKGLRFPQSSYGKLKNLLGRRFDDPVAVQYRDSYDNTMVNDTVRGTCLFEHNDGETTLYSVEELVAMQLSNARKEVEAFAGEPIRDAVITVPPYWTQHERQALLDAASIADIRVLSLMSDETAVALNYALAGRNFNNTPQHHIFYDMGAGSTVAALISFQNTRLSNIKRSERVTEIEVKAVGYDRTLGGNVFDQRLQSYMAKHFDETVGKKRGINIFTSHRAMAKLLKEANRVKHILSANVECAASIEGLIDEVDFRMTITRENMLAMTADVFPRLAGPIDSILKASGLTLDDVQSFVLVGGSIRVPAVQDELQRLVGADKIAKHVNQDEAAVLGAAFRGASILPRFRVKEFDIKDITVNPVTIQYASTSDDAKMVRQEIFKPTSVLGAKLKLAFKHKQDFNFSLEYAGDSIDQDKHFGVHQIANYSVTGLTDAIAQFPNSDFKVKVTVSVSDTNGLVTSDEAIAEFTPKPTTEGEGGLVDSVLSYFGGSDKEKDENSDEKAADESTKDKKADGAETGDADTNNTAVNDTAPSKEEPKKKAAPKVELKRLKVVRTLTGIPELSEGEKQAAIKRAKQMDEADVKRRSHDAARNNLEAFIYDTMDFMDRSEAIEASTESERSALAKVLSEESEWLSDHGEDPKATTDDFLVHLSNCEALYSPIRTRIDEARHRPEAIAAYNAEVGEYESLIAKAKKNDTNTGFYYNEEDVTAAETKAASFKQWLADLEAAQSQLKPTENAVLLVADVARKKDAVSLEIRLFKSRQRIFYKPKPPPKPAANETATKDDKKTPDSETVTKTEEVTDNETDKEQSQPGAEEGDSTGGTEMEHPHEEL